MINDNDALSDLTGLGSLTSLGGAIHILGNENLTSLAGLDNLNTGSNYGLFIYNNISLSVCEIGGVCNYLASPEGVVDIYNNAPGCNNPGEIANACGFTMPCLPYGYYHFTSQSDVDNFPAYFPACTELKGPVTIHGEDITNLNGLSMVTAIDWRPWDL